MNKKLCLEADANSTVVLTKCNFLSPWQKWNFRNYTTHYWSLGKQDSNTKTPVQVKLRNVAQALQNNKSDYLKTILDMKNHMSDNFKWDLLDEQLQKHRLHESFHLK